MAVVCSKIVQRRILNRGDLLYAGKIAFLECKAFNQKKATQASCAFAVSTTVSILYINS